jgi:chemotaxis protein CheX
VKEVTLDGFESPQPVRGEIRDKLLEPFITAAGTALREMTGVEVLVQTVYQKTLPHALGDLAAVIHLGSANEGSLVLGFPQWTAAALAGRILTGATEEVDENLIRDCVGEIANVVAGQAKALLADTLYRLAFSLPQVVVSAQEFRPPPGLDALVVAFCTDQGEFTLQLFLKSSPGDEALREG